MAAIWRCEKGHQTGAKQAKTEGHGRCSWKIADEEADDRDDMIAILKRSNQDRRDEVVELQDQVTRMTALAAEARDQRDKALAKAQDLDQELQRARSANERLRAKAYELETRIIGPTPRVGDSVTISSVRVEGPDPDPDRWIEELQKQTEARAKARGPAHGEETEDLTDLGTLASRLTHVESAFRMLEDGDRKAFACLRMEADSKLKRGIEDLQAALATLRSDMEAGFAVRQSFTDELGNRVGKVERDIDHAQEKLDERLSEVESYILKRMTSSPNDVRAVHEWCRANMRLDTLEARVEVHGERILEATQDAGAAMKATADLGAAVRGRLDELDDLTKRIADRQVNGERVAGERRDEIARLRADVVALRCGHTQTVENVRSLIDAVEGGPHRGGLEQAVTSLQAQIDVHQKAFGDLDVPLVWKSISELRDSLLVQSQRTSDLEHRVGVLEHPLGDPGQRPFHVDPLDVEADRLFTAYARQRYAEGSDQVVGAYAEQPQNVKDRFRAVAHASLIRQR